ncbi:E4 SUMO-protein ligase PIAL2-like isoform X2 [Lotus japonicus]|uniref:E4 SUMO-protein ligase PIAL2-like isoform X2 n=1 Tax=Lotus japonicus TaxID=34305 RepID=UPI00258F095F|nr:E4 SUMO-protein ligase PIAL2-like isoform X2 [Lotus japonicus]
MALQQPTVAAFKGTGQPLSPSDINSYRINAVVGRLNQHVQPSSTKPTRTDPYEFYNLCLSLSRGIDYALANGEIPAKAKDFPKLMKQICQRKNNELGKAAIMVLMISIKNACQYGWFEEKDSEELSTIANQIGNIYCSLGNVNAGPSSCNSTISSIIERFYPKMNMGPILVSIEAMPGYGASAVDFHITKKNVLPDVKIWLFVAQIDNIETSACLISPQQVNFLLNGKGVDRRTNVQMDTGPQMPTHVTGLLKFGTNLLQAVGQFNGHYIILVAYMSFISLPEPPLLQDYVQPPVTSVDSDSDIIEGPSQISLNCPISFTRIKTPVKGCSCKHFQCFDFDNFININSKKPYWRCPHCNQYVCYADIRLDRNMVEILKNVGENIVEVMVFADGSWKAVLEVDRGVDKIQVKAPNCEKEQSQQTELKEFTCSPSPSTVTNILDLTNDDDYSDIMDICATEDRKPSQESLPGQFVTPNSPSLGAAAQIEDDFFCGIFLEQPVLPDPGSPVFNQEAEGHENNSAMISAMCNQVSAPSNLHPQSIYMNLGDNEYGRSSSTLRLINRTPVAVQALPVQSQTSGTQQSPVTNLNSFLPGNSSATPHVSLPNPVSADAFNSILSDTERQQHFSRPPLNQPQVSGLNSSAYQHRSATQDRVPPVCMPAPTPLQNPYRSGSLNNFTNPHLQQSLNPLSPRERLMQSYGLLSRNAQTARATSNSQRDSVMAAAQAARQSQSISVQNQTAATSGEQRRTVGGTVLSVSRTDDLFTSQPDQNWRPTRRMRGSLELDSRHYPEAVTQRIIAPTQTPVLGSRPQGSQPVRPTGGSPQLDVLIANNKNAHK